MPKRQTTADTSPPPPPPSLDAPKARRGRPAKAPDILFGQPPAAAQQAIPPAAGKMRKQKAPTAATAQPVTAGLPQEGAPLASTSAPSANGTLPQGSALDIGTDTGATESRRLTDAEFDPSMQAGSNKASAAQPDATAEGRNEDANTPAPSAASLALTSKFEEEIARAASIGRRLAQAGSSLMSGLPLGASDQEIGLHLIRENTNRFERAVRTLELAADALPSNQGD
ncbi:MAG TPA: hypothetical protein VGC15_14260 [Acetobacteraceae bacterium]